MSWPKEGDPCENCGRPKGKYDNKSPDVCHYWENEQDYYFSGDEDCARAQALVDARQFLLERGFSEAVLALRELK